MPLTINLTELDVTYLDGDNIERIRHLSKSNLRVGSVPCWHKKFSCLSSGWCLVKVYVQLQESITLT